MVPADIARIVVVEELDVSGDGTTAVVARRTVRRGRYEKHLYVVDLTDRSAPRRLTEGRVSDRSPRLSPDGAIVAFLRSDPDDTDAPAALCTVPVRGGRVRRRSPQGSAPGFGAIGELAWSPDGRSIAFTAQVDPPRFVVGDRPAIGSAAARSPRAAGADGTSHHPHGLAMGRDRTSRPLVPPVRARARAGGAAAPGDAR